MSDGRGRIAAGGLAIAVLVVAVLAIAGVFGGDDDGGGSEPAADSFGSATTPAAATGAAAPKQPRVKRIEVGGRPDTIAAGAGYVWVADSFAGSLKRINPRSDRPISVEAAGFPTDVNAGEGAAWLALPDRGAVQRVTMAGPEEPVELSGFPFQVAAGEGGVWAMSQKSVERVDPGGGELDGPPIALEGNGAAIAAGEGWVWVVRGNREVVRISPEGTLAADAAAVPDAFNITVGEAAAWVLGLGTLTRIDPGSGEVAGDAVHTGKSVDLATGLGLVWVANADGSVLRIDPGTGKEAGPPVRTGRTAQSIAVGEGAVWVAAPRDGAVFKIVP